MRGKIWIAIAVAVLAVVGYWLGTRPDSEPVSPGKPAGQQPARESSGSTALPPAAAPVAPPAAVPAPAAAPVSAQPAGAPPATTAKAPTIPRSVVTPEERPEKIEADSIALNIRHYGQRFGGNPVGTNAEIVKQMMGDNEKRATYLPSQLQRLNPQGELIDRWGNPYFFHQLTSQQMEVRSAGPDRQMWTPDDIVAR